MVAFGRNGCKPWIFYLPIQVVLVMKRGQRSLPNGIQHGWKDVIALAGTEAYPESFFWRSEDGLDWDPTRALWRCLLFYCCFARSG